MLCSDIYPRGVFDVPVTEGGLAACSGQDDDSACQDGVGIRTRLIYCCSLWPGEDPGEEYLRFCLPRLGGPGTRGLEAVIPP
jgi:hypothetical protein